MLDNEYDLTQEQIIKFDSLYKSHEKKTSNEFALVTIRDYGIDTTIELFTEHLWKTYGFGKKSKNNGVVIVFSMTKHETRIATGLGMKNIVTNEFEKKIIDSIMIPQFKKDNYYEGLWNGSIALVEFLERPENKIK